MGVFIAFIVCFSLLPTASSDVLAEETEDSVIGFSTSDMQLFTRKDIERRKLKPKYKYELTTKNGQISPQTKVYINVENVKGQGFFWDSPDYNGSIDIDLDTDTECDEE